MSDEIELTPDEREVEAALRSLRPAPAQIDPVAIALKADRRTRKWQVRPWHLAAAAVAAGVIAGTAWLASGPHELPPRVGRQAPETTNDGDGAARRPIEPPTVMGYRRALAQSPAQLDALLDAHATMGGPPHDATTPISILTFWDDEHHSFPGEA